MFVCACVCKTTEVGGIGTFMYHHLLPFQLKVPFSTFCKILFPVPHFLFPYLLPTRFQIPA